MFREPVKLHYDGGSVSYKSILGSIFSVTLFIAIIAYGLKRFLVMISLKQFTTFSHYNYASIDKENELFGNSIGLRFAFGISDWDGATLTEEALADYGKINAYYERWNETSDVLIKVKTRPCVLADFGLDPNEKQAN